MVIPGSKFEPRLTAEVVKINRVGRGLVTLSSKDPIPVIITHQERSIAKPGPRVDMLKDLKTDSQGRLKPVVDSLRGMKVDLEEDELTNSVVTRLTIDQLYKIEGIQEVKNIILNRRDLVTCLDDSTEIIQAKPDVWDLGCTGTGIKVAVLDSGIDANHPALIKKVIASESTVSYEGVDIPGDHGTHVAGIIASQDGLFRGVAPDSELINIKVLDSEGGGRPDFVVKGIRKAIEFGADVINLSLGWNHYPHNIYGGHGWQCSDGQCVLCRAVDQASALGVVVVAAGNSNTLSRQVSADTDLGCPGNARSVITVGAVDKAAKLANFSSTGSSSYGWSKPDLCAPGISITSCITVTHGLWGKKNGTSMAAPHVSGIAGLLIQKFQAKGDKYTAKSIKAILKHTASSLGLSPNEQGKGLIDALTAIIS